MIVTSETMEVPCESEGVDIENVGGCVSQGVNLECILVAHELVTLLTHDLLTMLYLLSRIHVSYPKGGTHMWLVRTSSPCTQNSMRKQDEPLNGLLRIS